MSLTRSAALAAMLSAAATLATAQTAPAARAETPAPMPAIAPPPTSTTVAVGDGTMLLTVFFKHDQAKTLDEINEQLRQNKYYEKFPPPGIEVVSWYVVMGIGQIAVFRFPPSRLREMNRIIEETAWGGYRTEFFPTYDYKAAAETQRQQMLAKPR